MKILVRLPNWLGDVVMSTAFIYAARQLYPDAQIDVVIKRELSGIAELIPGLHKIHGFSKTEYKGLPGVYRFGRALRPEKYDLFFCLPDSFSSALMGWAGGSKKRVGFGKEGRSFLLSNTFRKPAKLHRVDEYVSLLEQFSARAITDRKVAIELKKDVNREELVVINFNSEAVSRRMPVDKAKQMVAALTRSFKTIKFAFVGSPNEKAYVDQILEGAEDTSRIENYAGKTALAELCRLMASAKAVLTTDSGPAHLSNALGVPTVALFGAGNEHNTAPYNKHNLTMIRAGKLECEPCTRNTCKLYGLPKCLQLIDDIEIINALNSYLKYA